jgi:hypothetical protein
VAVRGLCDGNEQDLFRRVLDDVYVCVPDLEGELIRALGVERTLEFVDRDAFATMQRQPDQRGRPIELQLHRWLRSSSIRYHRYLPVRSSSTGCPRCSRECSDSSSGGSRAEPALVWVLGSPEQVLCVMR